MKASYFIIIIAICFGLAACQQQQEPKAEKVPAEKVGPAQQLGKQIDESVSQAQQKVQKLTAPGGPIDKAGQQIGQEIQKGAQQTADAINKAIKKQPSQQPTDTTPATTN